MQTTIDAIGVVSASRTTPDDDNWGRRRRPSRWWMPIDESALDGIESFSHVEVLFSSTQFRPRRSSPAHVIRETIPAWPKVGIFAQRGKNCPNRIGCTICRVEGRSGRSLIVSELDAIDGTPVIDIKPVMTEFLPREPTRQPAWSTELMANYWTEES